MLTNISQLWAHTKQESHSEAILQEASKLHNRLGVFLGHFNGIATNLEKTVNSYNKAVGSFDRNVMKTARDIEDMAKFADKLVPLNPVEVQIRLSTTDVSADFNDFDDSDEQTA